MMRMSAGKTYVATESFIVCELEDGSIDVSLISNGLRFNVEATPDQDVIVRGGILEEMTLTDKNEVTFRNI